jgi:predicted dinucleotide-binding enzyme
VVHGPELALEGAELLDVALVHREGVRRDAVFLELRLDERERERRADEGNVGLALEQVGHAADVVFVAVREENADDVVEAVEDDLDVGQDQVDARLRRLGEEHADVDDEDLAVELERGHVAADLAESAVRNDAHRVAREGRKLDRD